jgi:hypothetical protein
MFIMGTITVNVDDDTERLFRKRVSALYGKRKGALGTAFSEAMSDWSDRKKYIERCMKLLHDGVDMGGLAYEKREELHRS